MHIPMHIPMHTTSPHWLLDRVPQPVIDSLTPTQHQAIVDAAGDRPWDDHVVDIRFTLPLILRRFYITVVGGTEKRSSGRQSTDRHKHPLRTIANAFFFIGIGTLFYGTLLMSIAVYSVIIEF